MIARTTFCARCGEKAVPTTLSCLAHLRSESTEDYEMEWAVDSILRAEFDMSLMDESRRLGIRQTLLAPLVPYEALDFSKPAHDLAFRIALE